MQNINSLLNFKNTILSNEDMHLLSCIDKFK